MKARSEQYAQFTPEERVRLALAANERDDKPELDRLFRSCPTVTHVIPDPRFTGPLMAMHSSVSSLLIQWVEVSGMIMGMSLVHDDIPAEDIARTRRAKAALKQMCGIWRGIEAGIEEFCAEVGLTSGQLLAQTGRRPTLVEEVGKVVHGNGRADRQTKETTRQRLWQAWEGNLF